MKGDDSLKNKAIVSGHIWTDEKGVKEIEILTMVANDENRADIFSEIDHTLIDNVEIGDSDDYYFIAIIESELTKYSTWEGTEYDVDYVVKEIKDPSDLLNLAI